MTPLLYLPRFRRAARALEAMAQRESWPRTEIEAWQLQRLNQLWSAARRHVPHYRDLAAAGDLPAEFTSLDEYSRRMPLLDKAIVRDESHRIRSEVSSHGSWQRTGGSTGTPMRVFWERAAHLQMLQAKYRMLQQWDLGIFDRTAFLWGHSGSVAPGLKGIQQRIRRPIEDRLRNRLRLSAYRLGNADLDQHLERLQRFAPRSLYGYSSAVALLARHAAARQIEVPSLRVAILTAEPADPEFLEQTARGLACDAAVEYGSVECGVIATTHRDGVLRVREDQILLETIPAAHGMQELVVTVLGNPAFPLMRYRIADMTMQPISKPESGFAVLHQVAGRRNDMLLSRSGRTVHSLAVKHVLEHYDSIRRFRAHQDCDGRLLVTIETLDQDHLSVATLEEQFVQLLEGYPAQVQLTDSIPGTLAGKHRWVISDLVARHQA
jgi:phenylacetate-CoA ligase